MLLPTNHNESNLREVIISMGYEEFYNLLEQHPNLKKVLPDSVSIYVYVSSLITGKLELDLTRELYDGGLEVTLKVTDLPQRLEDLEIVQEYIEKERTAYKRSMELLEKQELTIQKTRTDKLNQFLTGCTFKEVVSDSCVIMIRPDGTEVKLSSKHGVCYHGFNIREDWLDVE